MPLPAPAVLGSRYEPLPSCPLTDAERCRGLHKVTWEKVTHRLIEHPRDVIVEYPESSNAPGVTVAHIFNINPSSFYDPHFDFQYSLGDGHGGRNDVVCKMLWSISGEPVLCSKLRTSCKIFCLFYVIPFMLR